MCVRGLLQTLINALPVVILGICICQSLFRLAGKVTLAIRRRRAIHKFGCRPPRSLPQRIPWLGTDFLREYNDAKRSGRYAEYWREKHLGGRVHASQKELGTDEGDRTLTATVMGQPWLFTADAENIRAIHAGTALAIDQDYTASVSARSELFVVEPIRKDPIRGWIGDGVFTSDGHKWKLSRSLTRPLFTRAAISRSFENHSFEKHLTKLFENLPKCDGEKVDLQPLLKRLWLDVSTEMLFGHSANSHDHQSARFDINSFESSFEEAMKGMSARMHVKALASGQNEWQQAYERVHDIFDSEIDYVLRRSENRRGNGAVEKKRSLKQGSGTVRDALASAEDEEGNGKICNSPAALSSSIVEELIQYSTDRKFLRDQLLNIFIGAKDTAAIGTSDVFFHLARSPAAWQRIRAEALTLDLKSTSITFEKLKSLRYTQNVIAESLRLLSPVGRGLRLCAVDCILPRGGGDDGQSPILVRCGTRIETSISTLHYDGAIWGPEADKFSPERWEQQGAAEKSRLMKEWHYVPFLGGARMCPAQQLMLAQYAYVLVRFAQEFRRIENRDPEHEFVPEIVFSCQSKNGVQVAFYR